MGTKQMTELEAVNVTNRDNEPNKAGEFCFVYYKGNICGLDYFCPCGKCKQSSYLPFRDNELTTEPSWIFDGNMGSPSLTPSIQRTTSCRWHGYLTNGKFIEC